MTLKQFFKGLALVAVCLTLIDLTAGVILRHYYYKIQHGEQGRTTFAADSCTAEYVILGSSRAAHHYVSPVISNILKTSCYNAGKDKQRLRYSLAMLQMLYVRYTPKHIILDLNPQAFKKIENGLDELSVLLPYYHEHPEIRSIVNERNRFEWIKTYSNLYCYNSLPLKILFNNISNGQDQNSRDGYVPLKINKEIIPASPDSLIDSGPVDSSLIGCFREIIKITRQHGSQLYVVVSPIYNKLPADLNTLVLAESICRNEKIPFLNYSQLSEFLDKGAGSFVDISHLNNVSAVAFSGMLAVELKKMR